MFVSMCGRERERDGDTSENVFLVHSSFAAVVLFLPLAQTPTR